MRRLFQEEKHLAFSVCGLHFCCPVPFSSSCCRVPSQISEQANEHFQALIIDQEFPGTPVPGWDCRGLGHPDWLLAPVRVSYYGTTVTPTSRTQCGGVSIVTLLSLSILKIIMYVCVYTHICVCPCVYVYDVYVSNVPLESLTKTSISFQPFC